MESVGDILEHVCPCGGDPSFPMHEESLLHRTWLLGKAVASHDPLEGLPRPNPRELPEPVAD